MTSFAVDDLYGSTLIDSEGEKVGDVNQVYLDDASGEPDWVTVRTGFFGTNESFVPLRGATLAGTELRVPYSKDEIKKAPNFDAEHHLDVGDENRLYQHYGFDQDVNLTGPGIDEITAADVRERQVRERGVTDPDVDRDRTGIRDREPDLGLERNVDADRAEGVDFGRDRQDLRPGEQLTTEQATDAERRRRLRRYVGQDQGTVNADTEALDDDFRRR